MGRDLGVCALQPSLAFLVFWAVGTEKFYGRAPKVVIIRWVHVPRMYGGCKSEKKEKVCRKERKKKVTSAASELYILHYISYFLHPTTCR